MQAIAFATKAHKGQIRDDGTPYVLHPIGVATMLATEFGYSDVDTLCVAILHDVIEDCSPKGHPMSMYIAIKDQFGDKVAGGVAMLSKNMALTGGDNGGKPDKHKYFTDIAGSSSMVRVVKVADRIYNMSDMVGWPMKRIHNYIFETQVHVIPIALGTDERMAKRLQEVVAIQERRIKNHEWIDNDGKKSQRPLVKY